MPEPVLELALGEPVLFPLYTSTVRGDDKPGQVLRLPSRCCNYRRCTDPPRGQARRKRVPYAGREVLRDRHARTVLRVEGGEPLAAGFNVRDVLREPSKEDEEADESAGAVIDVFPRRRCRSPRG